MLLCTPVVALFNKNDFFSSKPPHQCSITFVINHHHLIMDFKHYNEREKRRRRTNSGKYKSINNNYKVGIFWRETLGIFNFWTLCVVMSDADLTRQRRKSRLVSMHKVPLLLVLSSTEKKYTHCLPGTSIVTLPYYQAFCSFTSNLFSRIVESSFTGPYLAFLARNIFPVIIWADPLALP